MRITQFLICNCLHLIQPKQMSKQTSFIPYFHNTTNPWNMIVTSWHRYIAPAYWPFVRWIHQSPVDSLTQMASNAELWCFLLCKLRMNTQMNRQWSGRWFEAPWRSCGPTVIMEWKKWPLKNLPSNKTIQLLIKCFQMYKKDPMRKKTRSSKQCFFIDRKQISSPWSHLITPLNVRCTP